MGALTLLIELKAGLSIDQQRAIQRRVAGLGGVAEAAMASNESKDLIRATLLTPTEETRKAIGGIKGVVSVGPR